MSEVHGIRPWEMGRLTVPEFNSLVEYENKKQEAAKKAQQKARR